jgi:hypothetical protein
VLEMRDASLLGGETGGGSCTDGWDEIESIRDGTRDWEAPLEVDELEDEAAERDVNFVVDPFRYECEASLGAALSETRRLPLEDVAADILLRESAGVCGT